MFEPSTVILGLGFAVLAPLIPLTRLSTLIWRSLARQQGIPDSASGRAHRGDLPLLIGVIERALYFIAWLSGQASFIGVWLAIKVAGGWRGWSKGQTIDWSNGRKTVTGRHLFNSTLVGSAVSLLNAVVGAFVTDSLRQGHRDRVTWLITPTVAFTYGIWVWYELQCGRPGSEPEAAAPIP
jgi:hypothetical protein